MNIQKIKVALAQILAKMGEIKTDKGVYTYEGEELTEGLELLNEEGTVAEDGDYTTEDGVTFTVKDGKVDSIATEQKEEPKEEEKEEMADEDAEATDEATDEPKEDVTDEEKDDDVMKEIEEIKNEIQKIKDELAKLQSEPVVEPIAEEFMKVDNENNKYAKYSVLKGVLKK